MLKLVFTKAQSCFSFSLLCLINLNVLSFFNDVCLPTVFFTVKQNIIWSYLEPIGGYTWTTADRRLVNTCHRFAIIRGRILRCEPSLRTIRKKIFACKKLFFYFYLSICLWTIIFIWIYLYVLQISRSTYNNSFAAHHNTSATWGVMRRWMKNINNLRERLGKGCLRKEALQSTAEQLCGKHYCLFA